MIDVSALDWRKNADGLLPVVVQDARTSQVLMLGYMNESALQQTLRTKQVTFYSRSKQRLWRKGEVSGNTLAAVSVTPDCDGDAMLVKAVPTGPTCHTGHRSCFGDREESALETIGLLMTTIQDRSRRGLPSSYTKKLLDGGKKLYGSKMQEEVEELVRSLWVEGRQRVVEESADLLYHFLVLLEGEDIAMEAVARELRKRRKD